MRHAAPQRAADHLFGRSAPHDTCAPPRTLFALTRALPRAEIDFPDFVQLAVPGQVPQAPPALLLHTVPGRRQQATLAALQGLRPEGETVLPAGIQPSKPHCFCIKMTRGSFVDYTRRCEPRVLRPGWRRLTGARLPCWRSCLLHCGVSDGAARVYNFDQHGYHLERWREAISVPLEQIGDFDAALRAHDKIHRDRGVPCVPLGLPCRLCGVRHPLSAACADTKTRGTTATTTRCRS